MEDIKTDFEKMMDRLNESLTNTAPKKLNFENLTDSLDDLEDYSVAKKRRLSPEMDKTSKSEYFNTNNSINTANESSLPSSPWQMRRMKADLMEANSSKKKLQEEIDRLHKLRTEMEITYENQVTQLKVQCDYTSRKVMDMEEHMKRLRQRESKSKMDVIKIEKKLNEQKLKYEEELMKLTHEKFELEANFRQVQNTLCDDLNEYKYLTEKLQRDVQTMSDEMNATKAQLVTQTERAEYYIETKTKNEKLEFDLEVANSRIKELEFEIASYTDSKEIKEICKDRLSKMMEMEKEVERLTRKNKELYELIGEKLLMAEQLHDLKTRLEREEGARAEASALQAKLSYAEQELKEWIQVAQDHCLPNMLVSPIALRARIEDLLRNDIIAASDKNTNDTDTKTKDTELQDLKHRCDIYAKNIEDLNKALKRHKSFKDRVQKKLFLISKERDCYKSLLENFEKDITLSSTLPNEPTISELQLRQRVDMLERALGGYKDLCGNLEKEVAKQSATTEEPAEEQLTEATVAHIKNELDTLRIENERLRRRKEELEMEMEYRCLKGDFNVHQFKVVHLKQNPAVDAYESTNNFVEKLQAEVERLKRRIKQLEEDNEVTQARCNETTNLTFNIKELNQLRAELESAQAKNKKMKEACKATLKEYREVCYMLFGYKMDRIDRNGRPLYNVTSMWAENEDEYLSFILSESNDLRLLETPYSVQIQSMIEKILTGPNTLPIFMVSLTTELYNRATITLS